MQNLEEMWVWSPDREDALEEGMATHCSVPAWRARGQRSPAGCRPWSGKESGTTEQLHSTAQESVCAGVRETQGAWRKSSLLPRGTWESSWTRDWTGIPCIASESHSVVSDSATPRTIQFREFSRPEHWSGEPFPSSGDLPNPGIEPRSPALQGRFLTTRPPRKPLGMKKTRSPKEFRAYRALCFCLAGNISIVNKCFSIHFSISNVSESE